MGQPTTGRRERPRPAGSQPAGRTMDTDERIDALEARIEGIEEAVDTVTTVLEEDVKTKTGKRSNVDAATTKAHGAMQG